MKRLNIVVNGISYDVTVEELKEGQVVTPKNVAPVAPVAASPTPAPSGGESITAPMPGNIWKVLVKNGQTVKRGDVLVILEAMKMENEINAPRDGVVNHIAVSEGQTVDTDALLVTLG